MIAEAVLMFSCLVLVFLSWHTSWRLNKITNASAIPLMHSLDSGISGTDEENEEDVPAKYRI